MKLRWTLVLGVVAGLAGAPLACWRTSFVEGEIAARPVSGLAPRRSVVDAGVRNEPSSPVLVKMQVLNDPGLVKNAVPLRAPSPEHPGGTLVLGAQSGIFEIDIDTGAVLRQAAAPVQKAAGRVAATRSGVIAAWSTHVAIFDGSLHLVAEHALSAGHDPGVSADGGAAVLARRLPSAPPGRFELVRFELSTGRRVATAEYPGKVVTTRESGAHVVALNGRIHVLATEPRPELATYDLKLSKVGAVVLPWEPITPGYPPVYSSLSAAGDELVVSIDGRFMTVDPRSGAVRASPELPAGTWSDSIAVDADGRVLLDTGYLRESLRGPLRQFATLGAEVWKLDAAHEPLYRDSPVSAFFWGGRAVVVTQHPGVSVLRLDLER